MAKSTLAVQSKPTGTGVQSGKMNRWQCQAALTERQQVSVGFTPQDVAKNLLDKKAQVPAAAELFVKWDTAQQAEFENALGFKDRALRHHLFLEIPRHVNGTQPNPAVLSRLNFRTHADDLALAAVDDSNTCTKGFDATTFTNNLAKIFPQDALRKILATAFSEASTLCEHEVQTQKLARVARLLRENGQGSGASQ